MIGQEFMHPGALWLLLLLIPLIAWYVVSRHKEPTMGVSSTKPFANVSAGWKLWLRHVLFAMRCGAIACLIIVIARPMNFDSWSKSHVEGTDILLALDISESMLAADLDRKNNRLEVAKKMARQFVESRQNDNMGLVLFAGESYSAVPLTSDRALLMNYLNAVNVRQIRANGTAIGDGIASAINRIKDGIAKSKSIILITDGTNNTGIVAPETAAEIARELDIKIYTIGVGANKTQEVAYLDEKGAFIGVAQTDPVDFTSLQNIASMTNGKYFAATSEGALQDVFAEIDKLEKTKFDVKNFTHADDEYMLWAWLAFGLFALQLLLKLTIGRSIP